MSGVVSQESESEAEIKEVYRDENNGEHLCV